MVSTVQYQCAAQVLSTVPMMMGSIIREVHRASESELSMHQFRAMMMLRHHGSMPVSQMAEHLGVSLPAVSKLFDVMADRGFISRETPPEDRRRVLVTLTDEGVQAVERVHQASIRYLASRMESLSEAELTVVTEAMALLQVVFAHDHCAPQPVK